MSEKTVTPRTKEELLHLAKETKELRASSLADAYCELSIKESNSNFESQRFGFCSSILKNCADRIFSGRSALDRRSK